MTRFLGDSAGTAHVRQGPACLALNPICKQRGVPPFRSLLTPNGSSCSDEGVFSLQAAGTAWGGPLGPPDLTQEATVSQGNYGLQGRLLPAVESRDLKHFGSKTFQDIHLEVFGFLVNQEGDL